MPPIAHWAQENSCQGKPDVPTETDQLREFVNIAEIPGLLLLPE
jgi:hypothetical protein